MRDRFDWWIVLFVIVYFSFLIICVGGCLPSLVRPEPGMNNTNGTKPLLTTMNWLAAFCVLGIGLSVFAIVQGNRLGLAGILASGVTLVATLTVAKYTIWIAWLGLVGMGIGLALICIYSIWVRAKAIKEIVIGVQKFKDTTPGLDANKLRERLAKQSKSTQKLVQDIKNGLKLKG